MEILNAFWTFPAIVMAAMLIAWATECGQFFISQGLALAVLAWVQTLPEFAVEGVIAFTAAKDPSKVHLITANYTGSLRLFVGLGWPMVYFVAFLSGKLKGRPPAAKMIHLDDEHAIAVVSLLPALLYFFAIYAKGTLNVFDALVLTGIYAIYLWLVSRVPPHDAEEIQDLGRVPRCIMCRPRPVTIFCTAGLFAAGALILFFAAHPFLNSMLAIAVSLGISQFIFVQWVAPFLSEFPEKLSAFHWARKSGKAPMALANFVSSSINQWTILVAMTPIIYSIGLGRISPIVLDDHQKLEIILTIVQSYLGFLFLAGMSFGFWEAAGLFFLWLIQFLAPGTRQGIIWVYAAWGLIETVRLVKNRRERNAFSVFLTLINTHQKEGGR